MKWETEYNEETREWVITHDGQEFRCDEKEHAKGLCETLNALGKVTQGEKVCPPEVIQICIAGDYDDARRACREWCVRNSRCVTVEKAAYVYSFGEESGVIVTFRSYPRFPPETGELEGMARDLLQSLMEKLCQRTAMLCTATEHTWVAL